MALIELFAIAVSAARALLFGINRELLERESRKPGAPKTAGVILEIDEVSDLDFTVRPHRSFHDEILRADGLLGGFSTLEQRIGRVRGEEGLSREAIRNVAALAISLAIAALTASAVGPGAVAGMLFAGSSLLLVFVIADLQSGSSSRTHCNVNGLPGLFG